MNYYSKLLCTLLVFAWASMAISNAQNLSNEGRDFWVTFPRHEPNGATLATMKLFITSKNNSSGVVTIGTTTIPFNVAANVMTSVDIPRSLTYLGSGGYFTNRAIRVTVNTNQPKVTVYANIVSNARTATSLILPVESLGDSYYVMGYNQNGTAGQGYFNYTIVATEPNTTVIVRQQVNQSANPASQTITLTNVGDVYQFLGIDDYTGTYVEVDPTTSACKKFAMFSGSSGVSIPFDLNGSLNPLFQQLYPANNWGVNYAYIPFSGPDRGCFLRVLAQEDNTTVNITGVPFSVMLNKGMFYNTTTPIAAPGMITADKPISVAQFALSERFSDSRNISLGPNYNGVYSVFSDPTMLILNPLQFGIRDITIPSLNVTGPTNKFINVLMKTAATSSFKLNGAAPIGNSFTTLGGGYSYMQLNVGIPAYSGNSNITGFSTIRLTADESFNAIVYGFGDYDAYAYNAGTILSASAFLTVMDNLTHQALPTAACKNQLLDLKVTLPYISPELRWTLNSASSTIVQTNPAYTPTIVDGDTLYEYMLVANAFNTVGDKEIKLSAKVVNANCSNDFRDFAFNFRVNDIPEAKFGALTQSCVNVPVAFSDMSNRTDSDIIQWAWNFGDGVTTTTQNPTRTYTSAGSYTVTLQITTARGCSSVFTQLIKINSLPLASFNNVSTTCQNYPVTFIDSSTSTSSTIASWSWDFGDGGVASMQHPTHTFTQAGTYTVRLTITNENGCQSMPISKTILVSASPEVSFESSGICEVDAIASFINTTTIADGSGALLTYLWNFGDPNASVSNPLTSSLKNPSHTYSVRGNYTITLTVTSSNSCSVTLSRPFLVNGDNPNAAFLVLNSTQLCSSEPVVFEDKASVDFGEIVRVDWYYDFDNNPSDVVVDNNPSLRSSPSKQYTYQYPVFHHPLTKTYMVKMLAYSGRTCVSEITQTIELKASPEVIFGAISGVCQNASPFMLNAYEASSAQGNGVFNGNGVVAGGMFSPALAGPGDHVITYTFNGVNGCAAQQSQTIMVFSAPIVNAGSDQALLYGETYQLAPQVQGNNLTYQWLPSTALSRDDILNPITSPKENITYTLIVTSADGCTNMDQIEIQVLQELIIPNVFTPNGDSMNNTWKIGNLDTYPGAIVEVRDRDGRLLFRSQGNDVEWDGKVNGTDLPRGVYYYFIYPKNRRNPQAGTITILR